MLSSLIKDSKIVWDYSNKTMGWEVVKLSSQGTQFSFDELRTGKIVQPATQQRLLAP